MRICKTNTDADDPVAQRRNAYNGRLLPLAHRLTAVRSRVRSKPLARRVRPAAGGRGGDHDGGSRDPHIRIRY
jgi:hypothetical protein